ncbi:MAG: hypothetical protein R3B90_15160 [Planctomycetaceae bacterium]
MKLTQILDVQGSHTDAIDHAGPGEIVAIVKVDDLHTGDLLLKGVDGVALPKIRSRSR